MLLNKEHTSLNKEQKISPAQAIEHELHELCEDELLSITGGITSYTPPTPAVQSFWHQVQYRVIPSLRG
jgi:hypothetical protein